MLKRLDRYLATLAVTLALEILVVELRDQIITPVRSEDPDGFSNIGNCVCTKVHANTVQRKVRNL